MQTRRKLIFQVAIASALTCFSPVPLVLADGCNLNEATVDSESKCQQLGTPSPDPGQNVSGDELRFKKSLLPPKKQTGAQDSATSGGAVGSSGANSGGSSSDVPMKPLKGESSCTSC
jgi:hypothetical protein